MEIPVIVFFCSPLKDGGRPSLPAGRSSQRTGGHRPFQPGLTFHVGVRGLFFRRPAPVACGSQSDPGLNCVRTNVARLCCNASCGDKLLSTAS